MNNRLRIEETKDEEDSSGPAAPIHGQEPELIRPGTIIQALLRNFSAKLAGKPVKGIVPSIAEAIRLFQFMDEIEENTAPDEIEVRWIDWDGNDSKL